MEIEDKLQEFINLSWDSTKYKSCLFRDINLGDFIIVRFYGDRIYVIYIFSGTTIIIPYAWFYFFSSFLDWVGRNNFKYSNDPISQFIKNFITITTCLNTSNPDSELFFLSLSDICSQGTDIFRKWLLQNSLNLGMELERISFLSLEKELDI